MRYRTYQSNKLNPVLVIIAINLLVYVFIFITKYISLQLAVSSLVFLGLPPPDMFWSQPWTIVTSMFVHVQFWHIFGNMITFFFFGSYLSRLVGNNKLLITYFCGGILGNILLLLLARLFPFDIAYGASGAVYAVAGALVLLRPGAKVYLWFFIPMPLWVVVLIFFVIFSFLPNIAWQAHLGGLAFGLIAGYFYRKKERSFF